MSFDNPRILICAPGSGSGKTLITCGILRLLQKRGLSPSGFKCGPDYIDPMFHKKVLGIPSGNLDLFLAGKRPEMPVKALAYTMSEPHTLFVGSTGMRE